MSPKKTALYPVHEKLGAAFTDFGGWDMPLKYANDVAEHQAVRTRAGIFDLSHMGEFRITGPDAAAFLDYALVSNMSVLKPGRAKYSILANDKGGVIDDLITYRLGDEEFLVVPNAANIDNDFAAMSERLGNFDVKFVNESDDTSLIAVQGPRAEEILLAAGASDEDAVRELKYYASVPVTIAGVDVLLARTGYTGEDGYEISIPTAEAEPLVRHLLADPRVTPAGLGARDTLRLEAGLPLHGSDIGPDTTPVEAVLGFAIAKSRRVDGARFAGFPGAEVVLGQLEHGAPRRLTALVADSNVPVRAHSVIVDEQGDAVGEVTSGTVSPTLGKPIMLAYLPPALSRDDSPLHAKVRDRLIPLQRVKLPFVEKRYKR